MTTKPKIQEEVRDDASLYFWLGADGEAVEVTKTEFSEKQDAVAKAREDWLNVRA